MLERKFEEWLSKFRPSISTFDYYTDFKKVVSKVEPIRRELALLNSLIGSKQIEEDFQSIVEKYPETLKCIPILLAIRGLNIYVQDQVSSYEFNFKSLNYSIEDYKKFMRKTGLFEMMEHHMMGNLYDYVLGVETGLDSNGRKNRGGNQMEDLVESHIQKAGFIFNVDYFKEMYLSDVEKRWGLDLSGLSNEGKSAKRFDFVLRTKGRVYAVETNFYGGGGSKLNETARSYKMLAKEAKEIIGFSFVWITDGIGWNSSKSNLRETFEVLEDIYNIRELEDGILKSLKEL